MEQKRWFPMKSWFTQEGYKYITLAVGVKEGIIFGFFASALVSESESETSRLVYISLSAHKSEMLPEQKEVWATMKILKMHPATYFLLSQLNWVCAVKYALGLQNTLVQNTHPVCRRALHCLVINQSSPPWIQIHSLCATIYFDLQHSTVLGAQVEATNDEFQEWWRGWLGHWPG